MGRLFDRKNRQPRRKQSPPRRRLWSMESLEDRRMLAVDIRYDHVPLWVEQGPGYISGGTVEGILDQPVTGAVSAIAVHPDNASIAWVGTVNGGVWRTTNALHHDPIWTPLMDQYRSLSISELALDPSDTNIDPDQMTIYAGTGVTSSTFIGGEEAGLYRSTDGGLSWMRPIRTSSTGSESPASPFEATKFLWRRSDFRHFTNPDCSSTSRPI